MNLCNKSESLKLVQTISDEMKQINADALVYLFDFLCRGLADTDGDCVLLALCEDGYDGVGWVTFVCWGELAALGSEPRGHDVGACDEESDSASIDGDWWE